MKSITCQTAAGITVTACIISFGIGFWIGSGSNWIQQFFFSTKNKSPSISLTPVDNPYEHTDPNVILQVTVDCMSCSRMIDVAIGLEDKFFIHDFIELPENKCNGGFKEYHLRLPEGALSLSAVSKSLKIGSVYPTRIGKKKWIRVTFFYDTNRSESKYITFRESSTPLVPH